MTPPSLGIPDCFVHMMAIYTGGESGRIGLTSRLSGDSSIVSDFRRGPTAQLQKHLLQSKPLLRMANQRCKTIADVNEYFAVATCDSQTTVIAQWGEANTTVTCFYLFRS